jgi:hypothetical protein
VLSWYPRIILFPAFLDASSVAQIKAMAKPLLQPSELGTAGTTEEQKEQAVRGLYIWQLHTLAAASRFEVDCVIACAGCCWLG